MVPVDRLAAVAADEVGSDSASITGNGANGLPVDSLAAILPTNEAFSELLVVVADMVPVDNPYFSPRAFLEGNMTLTLWPPNWSLFEDSRIEARSVFAVLRMSSQPPEPSALYFTSRNSVQ
ncbi:hypothetical protein SCP_0312030 [Sparassis crispa]|uniref:Uncharacterized protein n=1 Tax=Sparassis crispa TaxID=139825 RepID=A0A401GGZ6_9APHY|nr:hypothetical protein SCP_0312030 [Sparassis crispa]GBE81474.1 hypothetical protein SCP_0312030 [Sparassis crispa]